MAKSKPAINAYAPCRINDIGGWTDTPFAEFGRVCSLAVNPGVSVQVAESKTDLMYVNMINYNTTYAFPPGAMDTDNLELVFPAIAETIRRYTSEQEPLYISISGGMPPGSSTGTSAAVLVALIRALTHGQRMPFFSIPLAAYDIETSLGFNTGIQDQAAATYGNISDIKITDCPSFERTPVPIDWRLWWELESRLMLVYIGEHDSSALHDEVIKAVGDNPKYNGHIEELRMLASDATTYLSAGDLGGYALTMVANTKHQRELCKALVPLTVNDVFTIAYRHGALACKPNGAGGDGGSVTILCGPDPVERELMRRDLVECDYEIIPISLARDGLRVWEGY